MSTEKQNMALRRDRSQGTRAQDDESSFAKLIMQHE